MGKVTIQDIAAVLIQRRDLGKKEATQFVNEMFFVVQIALNQDKVVKVKGLGTFKIIDVEDRESVDVNTGDRVLIEGHGKITFTPDALMKEIVNKPFSQFETVVLKDGVDFDNMESEATETAQPVLSVETEGQPDAGSQTETAEEVIPQDDQESFASPSDAPLVDFVTEDDTLDTALEENSGNENTLAAETEETAPASGFFDRLRDQVVTHQKLLLAAGAGCVVCFMIGYLAGSNSAVDIWTPEDAYREAKTVEQLLQENEQVAREAVPAQPVQEALTQEKPEKDSMIVEELPKESPDVEAHVEKEPVNETPVKETPVNETPVKEKPTAPVKEVTKSVAKVNEKAAPAPQPESEQTEELDKYAKMDARIRTGAYRIKGTAQVYTVKAGDNLKRISKAFLGPDMECYIETYNGLTAQSVLKAGQKINIPKLEVRKGLKLSGKKKAKAPVKKAVKGKKK